jgi:3-methyladenine DNA glycosylase/8-oxoguanine DNA glycosylase
VDHGTRTVTLTRPLDLGLTLSPLRRIGRGDPTIAVRGRSAAWASRTALGPAAARYEVIGAEVAVEAWGPGAEVLLESAPALLGELDDPAAFAPSHPLLARLARELSGLRLTHSGAVFEALVPTVFEQKVIGLEARAGMRRMLHAWGEPAPGPLGLRLQPSPARLAAAPYWDLHRFGLEQRRAETLIRAARSAGRLEALAQLPPESAREALLALPGIGPWTAAEVTLVALGDPDAVSVGDYHLPSAVAWALAGEPRADDRRMLELLEPYRGQRGRVIRLLAAAGVAAPRRGPRLPLRHLERH